MHVYRYNKKLAVYIPTDVAQSLGIEENDEIDFFRYSNKAYLMAKKSEIAKMIMGEEQPVVRHADMEGQRLQQTSELGENELTVLKKLDEFRYPERSVEKVAAKLSSEDKAALQRLVEKKIVNIFQKDGKELYSISKNAYDRFLMRKKSQPGASYAKPASTPTYQRPMAGRMQQRSQPASLLEKNGFIVIPTEAEAASISLELEDQIRRGSILGTRAFNKKFYLILRDFFNRHSSKVIGRLREGPCKIDELAKATGLPEDATRAIIYMLAENGDAREPKRDTFALT